MRAPVGQLLAPLVGLLLLAGLRRTERARGATDRGASCRANHRSEAARFTSASRSIHAAFAVGGGCTGDKALQLTRGRTERSASGRADRPAVAGVEATSLRASCAHLAGPPASCAAALAGHRWGRRSAERTRAAALGAATGELEGFVEIRSFLRRHPRFVRAGGRVR
jgi:hypothetical protein